MLWPARMYGVECVIYERFRASLVERLHTLGVAQIDSVDEDFVERNSLKKPAPAAGLKAAVELISKCDEILSALSHYDASKQGLVESTLGIEILPEGVVDAAEEKNLAERPAEFVDSCLYDIRSHEAAVSLLLARSAELEEKLKNYGHIVGLPCPLECFTQAERTKNLVCVVASENYKPLLAALKTEFGPLHFVSKFKSLEGSDFFVLSVPAEFNEKLSPLLHSLRVRVIEVEGDGTVKELLGRLSAELESTRAEQAKQEEAMRGLCVKYRLKTLVARELLEMQKQRHVACENFVLTEKTVLIRLWVPKKNFTALTEAVEEVCGGLYTLEVDENPKDAPVLLDNPGILKPFEMFTRMFSMPNYRQLDPTALFAPTFVLFFGLMFSDAVYGILVILAAYLLNKKYGVRSKFVSDLSRILTWFGLSSIAFGFVTGSFLGDFFGKYVLGREDGSQAVALWLDPLYNGNIMTYIKLSLLIGLVHTLLGYFFGAVDSVKRGEYKFALVNSFTMIMFPLGLMAYFFADAKIGAVLAVVSLLVLLAGSGLMNFYIKVSGLLGSVVSYARLLALMASSSGIAMTVNFLSMLALSVPHAGVILAPLVFIGGHVINLALNILGSFVHSLRLHYVEFFGTFYEGGGVEFAPFSKIRKYSMLERR